jgi:lactoylglutathione lyase
MSAGAGDALLHVVYRVGDLERTREFLSVLGLKVLRERDIPEEKYTNVFFGAGPESNAEFVSLELTYNYGVESYDVGTGFGHIGISLDDVAKVVERLRGSGFKVTREPGVQDGMPVTAAVEDPTGYCFELMQMTRHDPVSQIAFRVGDLDSATKFYQALGMKELRRQESEEGNCSSVTMGYGSEVDSTVIQLIHRRGVGVYTSGDGYGQIAVRTKDVYEAEKIMGAAGFQPARKPGPVPGIGTKIVAFRDPDDWKTVLVDATDVSTENDSFHIPLSTAVAGKT